MSHLILPLNSASTPRITPSADLLLFPLLISCLSSHIHFFTKLIINHSMKETFPCPFLHLIPPIIFSHETMKFSEITLNILFPLAHTVCAKAHSQKACLIVSSSKHSSLGHLPYFAIPCQYIISFTGKHPPNN